MGKDYTYLVRTMCATYNQENYIKDALNGFIIQETTFPVVYMIVDDASTDRTPEVIQKFMTENFDLQDASVAYDKDMDYGHVTFAPHKTNKNCYFAIVYLKENHYSQKKSRAQYLKQWMDTKYHAICEGDDYWIDPLKLQKQVDFLESHEEYDLCCASSRVYAQKSNCFKGTRGSAMCEKYYTIIQGYNDINTATVLVRTEVWEKCIKELSVQLPKELLFDTAYWYWFAFHDKTKYMPEQMSVYRVLENSASHTSDNENGMKMDLRFLRLKLEFLLRYPLSKGQDAVVDDLIHSIEGLCDYSRHLGGLNVRKTKTFRIGAKIKRMTMWRRKMMFSD